MKRKTNKGITLIALVVTIVVLLILAGASIAMLTGDNGIIVQAKRAREENIKGEIKEELELEIADMRANKASKGEELTKQEVIDRITEKGVVVTDSEGNTIQGEYKDYEITIDENYNVTVGGALTGAKPEVEITVLPAGSNPILKLDIKVIATTEEGEIKSIETLSTGMTLKETVSEANKTFTVTENGIYKFKITGTNKRIVIKEIEVKTITEANAESVLEGISRMTSSGNQKISVIGTISGKREYVEYPMNVIVHKGNLVLNGTTAAVLNDGEKQITVTPNSSKVYQFGSTGDIGTESANAKNTVVLKVDGNLTINSGVTLTAVGSSYGGPKGLIIYCTGTLANNGTISMTARGAKAAGQNVYLWKNTSNSYEYIPAVGATGAASAYNAVGKVGGAGTSRQLGGGGSGAQVMGGANSSGPSGKGATATSYSGGSGGGSSEATRSGGAGVGNGRFWWKNE